MGKNMLDFSLDEIVSANRQNNARRRTFASLTPRGGINKRVFKTYERSGNTKVPPLQNYRGSRRGKNGRYNSERNIDGWDSGLTSRGGRKANERPRFTGAIVRVSNLDYSVLEDDLRELFLAIGEVQKVWIDYDKTDRSKGTGGCIFVNADDAYEAVKTYEGKKVEGLALHLEVEKPSSSSSSRGGNWRSSRGISRASNY